MCIKIYSRMSVRLNAANWDRKRSCPGMSGYVHLGVFSSPFVRSPEF